MLMSVKNNSDGRVVTLIVSATGAGFVATSEWGRSGAEYDNSANDITAVHLYR